MCSASSGTGETEEVTPAFLELTLHSPTETFALAEALASALRPGDVLALTGELGSGKTTLVRGIARALRSPDAALAASPTFVLEHVYRGPVPIFHFDAYRLENAAELSALGFEERLRAGGIVAVEWADKVRECIPEEALWIVLEHADPARPETRRLLLRSAGGDWPQRLSFLRGSA